MKFLIDLALLAAGFIIGTNLGSKEEHMKGFDEGFKAGKKYFQRKIELSSLYGKFDNGREE